MRKWESFQIPQLTDNILVKRFYISLWINKNHLCIFTCQYIDICKNELTKFFVNYIIFHSHLRHSAQKYVRSLEYFIWYIYKLLYIMA